MAEFGVGTTIITGLPFLPQPDCPQAGEIITSVRDMVPDPLYDEASGEPLPDADSGFLRASTLYRWLTAGIRELTRRANWVVMDWTAEPQTERQQIVSLDKRWINVDGCFVNQYRLMHLDELHTTYPSYAVAQPLWFSWHHRSDRLELSLWPAPDRTDPTVRLMSTINPDTAVIDLSMTTNFLPFGWLRIEQELLQYSSLSTDANPANRPGVRVTRRGVGGTTAVHHFAGVEVHHCGVWMRGLRVPSPVTKSTDCVELPFAFQHPLEVFVLAKVKEAEQDRQGAASLMQEFREATDSILNDPAWQQPPWPSQVRAYGDVHAGAALYHGRVIVP